MNKLTDAQRILATEHHNLIYTFLNQRNLPRDEWYGIVAEGFVKAAMYYDPTRGAFSTLAYKFMDLCVRREYTTRGYRKRKGTDISLHEELWSDGLTLQEILAAPDDIENKAILGADLAYAVNALSKEEHRLLAKKIHGATLRELGQELGLCRQSVLNRLTAINDKIQKHLLTGREGVMGSWTWDRRRKRTVYRLLQEGKTPVEIAAELGCRKEAVWELMRDIKQEDCA